MAICGRRYVSRCPGGPTSRRPENLLENGAMKLVIFDCDGTLVDSQHNITAAMAYAFAAHDLPAPTVPQVLSIVGLSLPETFEVLAGQHSHAVRRSLADHYRDAFALGRIERRHEEPLYPVIRETIVALAERDDIVLGVATGKSKRGVARLFDRESWHPHFHTIQTADDHPSKPHPSMILRAMAESGVGPEATVMIGDTSFDMAMAGGAGVGAIGVGWGYHATDRLIESGAHAVVTDGAHLLEAIEMRLRVQGALR
jgi:phosphoglycolate phosphatase